MPDRTLILNHEQIAQKVNRIAYQIYEDNYTEQEIILAGIAPQGYHLAKMLVNKLKEISALEIRLGEISIDKKNTLDHPVTLDLSDESLENKVIVVVDDVLNSGRTLIYALNYFLRFPLKRLSTAVLVNRSHRRFPVAVDYEGMSLATTLQEHIEVTFEEEGAYSAYLH